MSQLNFKRAAPIKRLPLKWGTNHVVQWRYAGKYTRTQIKDFAQRISNDMKKKANGVIMVSLDYPDIGWRSGDFSKFGDPVILHEHSDSNLDIPDPDHFDGFALYFLKANPRVGGNDEHNDCLWKVLNSVLLNDNPWKTPGELKKYLKLKRDDKIPIDCMPKIEKKIPTYKINVTGDHIYTSTSTAIMEIPIKLLNEHYTYDNTNRKQIFGINYKELPPLCYLHDEKNNKIITYDGKEKKSLTREEFKTVKKSYKYVMVMVTKEDLSENETNIEGEYKRFMHDATILKRESEGQINLFKTGTTRLTALNYFEKLTKAITPEPIKQDEAHWLSQASFAPLVFSQPYKGKAYKYDYCSMYASSMIHKGNVFPIKRGIFSKMTQEEFNNQPFIKFGIYRCTVEESNTKLFRYNKRNYYTWKDLRTAQDLKLKITLIQDDQPNALIYPRTHCVTGYQMFGKFVETLFHLKKRNVPRAKDILVCIWGALGQKNSITMHVNDDSEKVESIGEDKSIMSIRPTNTDHTLVEFVNNKEYYVSDYARVAPFVLANGRFLMSNTMKPHIDKIVRCHTDGIISTCELPFKTGNELGDIKYEGYAKHIEIKNIRKTWDKDDFQV